MSLRISILVRSTTGLSISPLIWKNPSLCAAVVGRTRMRAHCAIHWNPTNIPQSHQLLTPRQVQLELKNELPMCLKFQHVLPLAIPVRSRAQAPRRTLHRNQVPITRLCLLPLQVLSQAAPAPCHPPRLQVETLPWRWSHPLNLLYQS